MTHMIGRIRRRAVRARYSLQHGPIQPKLRVGPQNDRYEREADAVASKVMAGQAAPVISALTGQDSQRKCAECDREEPQDHAQRQPAAPEKEEDMAQAQYLQRQPEEEEEEPLQAKFRSAAQSRYHAGVDVSATVAALRGGGAPLSQAVRARIEPRFGADFSHVRVHTEPQAAAAADALGARAFTTGRDVVFAKGAYAPGSHAGGTLLAHELTHVVQQTGGQTGGRPGAQAPGGPLQRWSVGTDPVPTLANWRDVPDGTSGEDDHTARLSAARAIVAGMVENTRCQTYFRENCDSGTAGSLRAAFNAARVYHLDVGGTVYGETVLGTGNIAYNRTSHNMGKWFLAATLLHELYHVCAPAATVHDREFNAETAVERCRIYAPLIERISARSGAAGSTVTLHGIGFGPVQQASDHVELAGTRCAVVSWVFDRSMSAVAITVRVPDRATSGAFRVFNNGVPSNPQQFSVL